jgi:predicted enzyme related to lactoylglutathione lyase
LEDRREIDHRLILGALKFGPKRFTDLYHTTHLSRKTLSFRLKDLCKTKAIVKKDKYYHLNGISSHQGEKNMLGIKDMRKAFSIARNNLRLVTLLLLWIIPTTALAYALMTRTSEIKIVSQPPIACFNVSPASLANIGWEVEGAKIISGITVVSFDASSSSDLDGYISEYIWNFGDGSSGRGVSITHVYSSPGSYSVRLTVVDNTQLSTTVYKELTVYANPTARIFLQLSGEQEVGGTLTVYIIVENITELYGWQAGLMFNPDALECLSFEKGEDRPLNMEGFIIYNEGLFSGTQGVTTWYQPRINNKFGSIYLAGGALIGDQEPVSGTGKLAKATFKVLSLDNFNLKLTDVILCAKDTSEIPVIVNNL